MADAEGWELGYRQGRRDMLIVVQHVIDQVRVLGFRDDEMDIDVLLDGITLGLMEAEDEDHG